MTHSENPDLKEVHEVPSGKHAGKKFYTLKDMKKISARRGISALAAERFIDMKLDKNTMKALLDEHRDAAKSLDIEKCLAIVYEIRHRLEFITEEKSILDLVCLYFFIDDEDIDVPSDEVNAKKMEIINSDEATRGFFLRVGLNLTRTLSDSEEENMISYLKESKHLAERVNRFFGQTRLESSESTSTN
jgi:hypothetical protein